MSKIGIQLRGTGAVRTGLRGGGIAKRGTGAALKTGGRAALWNGGPPNTGRTNLLEQLGRVEAERSNPNRRAEISRVHGELNRGYKDGGRTGKALGSIVKGAKKVIKTIVDKVKKGKGSEKGKKGLGSGIKPSEMRETIPTKEGRKEYLKVWSPHYGGKRADYGKKQAEGGRIGKKHGFQILGGGVEGKPHSTREGRDAAGRRTFKRIFKTKTKERDVPWGKSQPKWKRPIGKFPPEKGKWKRPIGKFPPEKGKWQEAAEGGRIGLKKGGNGKWMQKVSASIKRRGTKGKCTPITKPGCTGRAKALAKTFKKIAARRKG